MDLVLREEFCPQALIYKDKAKKKEKKVKMYLWYNTNGKFPWLLKAGNLQSGVPDVLRCFPLSYDAVSLSLWS